MWAINTLLLYNCTEKSTSPFRQSHVGNFPRGRVKSVKMYHYTKSTLSQTLTVVQHTFFDLQVSKRLFYTYNTVVLFNNIIIIIAVGVLSTLELKWGPEHARSIWFSLTPFFYLSSYRFRTEIFPFFCFVLILDYQILMLFCYIISFNILVHFSFVIYPMSDIMLSAEKATSPTAFINTLLLKKKNKEKWVLKG